LERQQTVAEAKAITLKRRVLDRGTVWGDQETLVTAMDNLIANAINYSPEGSAVEVTLAQSNALREVIISVADKGIGIAPADQERVFERFYRADQARSRRTGGTGLGLAIVRNAVAAHGGKVALRSKPGAGSVFTLRLPLYQPKEAS
jgi:two-component system sensor histidine kinase SenX3